MITKSQDIAIVIMARVPSADGKSRLSACLSRELRAGLQRAFLLDTLSVVRSVEGAEPFVAFHPQWGGPEMLGVVGSRAGLIAQQGRDLGGRLQSVVECLFQRFPRVILIGADSPTIQPSHLRAAIDSLKSHEACLGPAEDGGYYLIGLRQQAVSVFQDIDCGCAEAALS